jgi:hypothetical protein
VADAALDAALAEKPIVLPEIQSNMVMAVLSPACDLQRNQLKRVLLLVGELHVLKTEAWSAKNSGAKTPVFDMGDGVRRFIQWNLKHILTLTHDELNEFLLSEHPTFERVGRLRDMHALEIQQKLLSSMGRVGLAAPMPATHAVRIQAFTVDTDNKLRNLNIASLEDGGVCFIGRTSDGLDHLEKLILTERGCEDICRAIDLIDIDTVHEKARDILKSIQKSTVLYETLERGIVVGKINNQSFQEFKSDKDVTQGVVARNKKEIEKITLDTRSCKRASGSRKCFRSRSTSCYLRSGLSGFVVGTDGFHGHLDILIRQERRLRKDQALLAIELGRQVPLAQQQLRAGSVQCDL